MPERAREKDTGDLLRARHLNSWVGGILIRCDQHSRCGWSEAVSLLDDLVRPVLLLDPDVGSHFRRVNGSRKGI